MDMPIELPVIRDAREDDIAALAAIFAQDEKGGHGDTADPAALPVYLAAFHLIAESPDNRLFVVEFGGEVAGTAQVTFTTSLSGRGSTRMTIEAVQMRADMRGRGYGELLMRHCIELGREKGVRLVDLMSNAVRTDAHRFYERLGFVKSHVGFKKKLG